MAKTTATGADLKKFFADDTNWNYKDQKDVVYLDEDVITIDGEDYTSESSYEKFGENYANLPDDAKVTKVEGFFGWQGRGERPAGLQEDFGRAFNKWVKNQQVRTLVASFEINVTNTSREQLEELTSTLARLGAKISGLSAEDLPSTAQPEDKPRGPRMR